MKSARSRGLDDIPTSRHRRHVATSRGGWRDTPTSQLSLTDCVSFELIDRFGLTTAFSFDRDFRDCGYQMLP